MDWLVRGAWWSLALQLGVGQVPLLFSSARHCKLPEELFLSDGGVSRSVEPVEWPFWIAHCRFIFAELHSPFCLPLVDWSHLSLFQPPNAVCRLPNSLLAVCRPPIFQLLAHLSAARLWLRSFALPSLLLPPSAILFTSQAAQSLTAAFFFGPPGLVCALFFVPGSLEIVLAALLIDSSRDLVAPGSSSASSCLFL